MSDSVEVTLDADARSAAQARRFVTDHLRQAGEGELAEAAELLVSELVANAVLHAQGQLTVAVIARAGGVRVEVSDGSVQGPRPRQFTEEASTGRGLLLVEAMASSWGVTPTDGGKTVWFELTAEGAA